MNHDSTYNITIEGFDHSIHIVTPDAAFFIEDYREEPLTDEVKALLKDFILKIGL